MSVNGLQTNQLVMEGEVAQIAALRYTPAGIPVLSFVVKHLSEQVEAGMKRRVECELAAIAMGELAVRSQGIKEGVTIKASGFLARRSLRSSQLVLHINALETVNLISL